MNTIGYRNKSIATTSRNTWKLTDSLKEEIAALARQDAEKNCYMGNEYIALRKSEVSKVAPDRTALIGGLNQDVNSMTADTIKQMKEADLRLLYLLFGKPCEAECQSEGVGSAVHVYNENGEEILTYTMGVGWQQRETKAESEVSAALKMQYYEAYCAAREDINAESAGAEAAFDARA